MENTVIECLHNYDEKKPLDAIDHRPLPLKTMKDKCLIIRFHPDKVIFQFKYETRKKPHHQNFDPSRKHLENLEKSTGANDDTTTSKTNTTALYKSTVNTIVSNLFSEPIYINHFVGKSEPNEQLIILGPRCMWLQSSKCKRIIEPWRIEGIPANIDFITLKEAIVQKKLFWHVINSNYVRACMRILGGVGDETRRRLSINDEKLNREQFDFNIKILKYLNDFVSNEMISLDAAANNYYDSIKEYAIVVVNSGHDYLALARMLTLKSISEDEIFTIKLSCNVNQEELTSALIQIKKHENGNILAYENGINMYTWEDLAKELDDLATDMQKCYEHAENLMPWQQRILGHRLLAIGILEVISVTENRAFLTLMSMEVLQNFMKTVNKFLSLSLTIETHRLHIALPIWLIDVISIARGDRLYDKQPLTFRNMFTNVVENEDGSVNVFYAPQKDEQYLGYIELPVGECSPAVAKPSRRGLHVATCSQQFKIIKQLYDTNDDEKQVIDKVFRNIRELNNNESHEELHHDRLDCIGAILASNSVARFFEITSQENNVEIKLQQFRDVLRKIFHVEEIEVNELASVLTLQEYRANNADNANVIIEKSLSTIQVETIEVPELYKNAFEENRGRYGLLYYVAQYEDFRIKISECYESRGMNTWKFSIQNYPSDPCYSKKYESHDEALRYSYRKFLAKKEAL